MRRAGARLDGAVHRLVTHVLQHRLGWAGALLATAAVSAWFARRVHLRLEASDLAFAAARPDSSSAARLAHRWDGRDRLLVLLRGHGTMLPSEADALFTPLAARLRDLPGVEQVRFRVAPETTAFLDRVLPSLLPLYLDRATLETLADRLSRRGIEAALLHPDTTLPARPGDRLRRLRDPLGVVGLVSSALGRRSGAGGFRPTGGYFALPGGQGYVMAVQLAPLGDLAESRRLIQAVQAMVAAAGRDPAMAALLRGRELLVLGRRASGVRAYDLLYQDLQRILLAALVAVPLLLLLSFRRLLAPWLLILPVGFGLLVTMGIAGATMQSLSLVSWIFAAFLVGLGVDFGIHILGSYWLTAGAGVPRGSLAEAVKLPARGIIFGALTSAGAFFTLQLVEVPAMREIAWLTGGGLLLILFASFTLLPLILSLGPERRARPPVPGWARWRALLGTGARRTGVGAALPWVVLLVAAAFALPRLRFQPDPDRLLAEADSAYAEIQWLSRVTGIAPTTVLVASRGSTPEAALELDREAARRVRDLPRSGGVAAVVSPSRWWPSPGQQEVNRRFLLEHPGALEPGRFRRDFAAAVSRMDHPDPYLTQEYLPRLLRFLQGVPAPLSVGQVRASGVGGELDRQLVRLGNQFVAVTEVYLRPTSSSALTAGRFVSAATEAGLQDLPGVEILGRGLRFASYGATVRRDALRVLLLATLVVAIILWLQFRSTGLVALCLVPLAVGLAASLIVLVAVGAQLNAVTLAIAPILVGIGLDDGIHVTERLRAGDPPVVVLEEIGPSLAMTTLTSVAAFACLALARVSALRELGLIGAAGLIVCLAGAVQLVPLVWAWGHTRPEPVTRVA